MLEIEPFFVENRNEQPLERVSGTLWAWGYNRHGELGIGTAGETYPQYSYSSPIQVGTLNTWSSVACGWLQAFGQMQDGSLFSWGFNDGLGPSTLYGGQLGLGDTVNRSSPTQIGSLTTWSHLASGSNSGSAGLINGKAYVWGGRFSFPFGYVSSPVQLGSRTDWTDIVVQAHFGHGIIGGKLYGWGENDWGNMANGYTTDPGLGPTSPIQLGSRTDWFKNVNGFNVSSLALDTQRKLWGWGQNDQGQLGNNGHISKQTYMTEVSGDHRWSEKIALGKYHCLAIDTDGHLWVWGGNFYGQLGLSLPMGDQSGYRSVPIQLGNDRWVSVAAGQHQSHGVKADGTLWSWGKSKYGRLGINQPYGPKNSPIQVGTLNTWLAVACGEYTGFAIRR